MAKKELDSFEKVFNKKSQIKMVFINLDITLATSFWDEYIICGLVKLEIMKS